MDTGTDGWTESDTYEPTVQYAQVGSKIMSTKIIQNLVIPSYVEDMNCSAIQEELFE